MNALIQLFIEGGALFMSLITLTLVSLFLAAWKAPAWVKEIGLMALAVGLLGLMLGCRQAAAEIQAAGTVPPAVLCAGVKVMLIAPIYGTIVWFVSLILRIILKPRI